MNHSEDEGGILADLTGRELAMEMPQNDSIIFSDTFTSPRGNKFVITKTLELDAYEYEKKGFESRSDVFMANAIALAESSDTFGGTSRKAAKLSLANANTEIFGDLKDLIDTLQSHQSMVEHQPIIKTGATSNRVAEERRNVKVSAFLYAASREDDNDFHLIVGRDPNESEKLFMTMEISGLPPESSQFFARLQSARDAYKAFFNNNLPGLGYDFYNPPPSITIEGSLFFDMSHATGSRPGPSKLKPFMPVVWEVHPVTGIEFES